MKLNMDIMLCSDTAIYPKKAHDDDACFDIFADLGIIGKSITIEPHTTVKIPSGFATAIPHGYWGAVFARSGLASKNGLRPAQGVAVIDENYRGEWFIPIHNDTDETKTVKHGDRIAQFALLPTYEIELNKVYELGETERGSDGFGSTGN